MLSCEILVYAALYVNITSTLRSIFIFLHLHFLEDLFFTFCGMTNEIIRRFHESRIPSLRPFYINGFLFQLLKLRKLC